MANWKKSLKVANHGSAFTISGIDINLMKIIKTRGVLFVRIKYIYVDADTPGGICAECWELVVLSYRAVYKFSPWEK